MNKWLIIGIVAVLIIGIIIAVKYGKKSGELAAVKNQPGIFNPFELTQLSKQQSIKTDGNVVKMNTVKLT